MADRDYLAALEPMLLAQVLWSGPGLEQGPDHSNGYRGMVQVLEATRNHDHWMSASGQRVFRQIDRDHPSRPSTDRHHGRFLSELVLWACWGE